MKLKFTLGEFIDNIEKDGLPQGRNHTFSQYRDVRSGDACAIGQGYWNLLDQPNNINLIEETEFLNQFNDQAPYFMEDIIRMNDTDEYELSRIVSELRNAYADQLNNLVTVDTELVTVMGV